MNEQNTISQSIKSRINITSVSLYHCLLFYFLITYIFLYFHFHIVLHSFCMHSLFLRLDTSLNGFLKTAFKSKEYIFTFAKIRCLCHLKNIFQLLQTSNLNQNTIIMLRVLCLVQIILSLSLKWNEFILYAHQTKNGSRTVKIFEHL